VWLFILNLLNFFDAYFTYVGVSGGYLIELNPLMDYLLSLGSFAFFTCKIGLVGLSSGFLYLRKDHYLAPLVIKIACVIYAVIGIIHLTHLSNLS